MCRMVLANAEGIKKLKEALAEVPGCSTLEQYLAALELRDGGHGNGYALYKGGIFQKLEKGVSLTVEQVAQVMEGADYDWCIYHAREASTASVTDANCHPFRVKGKTEIVAGANGNERSLAPLAATLGITDTEFILRMAVQMELPFFESLRTFESNFFGFLDGRPFVKKGNRDMLKWESEGAIVFASDFPFGMEGFVKPEQDYVWYDGKEL